MQISTGNVRSIAWAASGVKSFGDEWAQLLCAGDVGTRGGRTVACSRARGAAGTVHRELVSEVHGDVRAAAGSVPGTLANYNYRANKVTLNSLYLPVRPPALHRARYWPSKPLITTLSPSGL